MDVGDIVAGIRRLRGVPEAAPRVGVNLDPDVVRYLDSLGANDRAWYSQFGFRSPDPLQPRPLQAAAASMDSGVPAAPDMSLGSPLWHQADKSARAYDNLAKGRTANLRNQNPDFVRIAQANIADARSAAAARSGPGSMQKSVKEIAVPAATAATLGGAALLAPGPQRTPPGDLTTGGEADLAEESRPVPKVAATDADGVPTDEAAFTDMFKRQYLAREAKREEQGKGGYANKPQPAPQMGPSDRAKAILRDLNERRRKAGREVPEAQQMIAEANKLLAQGDAIRNAPSYKPGPASNPREKATAIIQQLNAMRRAAGREVPQARQMLAEVARLHQMADAQDWR